MPPPPEPTGTVSDATSADMAAPASPPLQLARTGTADMSHDVSTHPPTIFVAPLAPAAIFHQPYSPLPVSTVIPAIQPTAADTTGSGDASAVNVTALADDLEYTLTVGQALEWFAKARRKVPSERSVQRYCIDGQLAAQKIRTTYGSEWLINETSLSKIIDAQPEISSAASVATSAYMAAPASPSINISQAIAPDTTAIGGASDAVATPITTPEGERRSITEVLIENARLVAQVEGKDAIIEELKEDKNFLREEVREARKTRDDVKNIAERMLDTLKTMAIGRLASATPREETRRAEYVDRFDQRSG